MDHTEVFPALNISTLRIRLASAALTVAVDEVEDIQVVISGEQPDSVRLARQEGMLTIVQPLLPLRKASEVTVLLPMDWKGALDAHTLSGAIHAMGVTGTDLILRSVTGPIESEALTGIAAHMRSLFGEVSISDLACDRCTVRTLAAPLRMAAGGFMAGRISALYTRADLDLAVPFDALSIRSLFGGLTVTAPIDRADATLASVRGRMLTDGMSIAAGAPRISMQSITANVQLICSLDNQAAMN